MGFDVFITRWTISNTQFQNIGGRNVTHASCHGWRSKQIHNMCLLYGLSVGMQGLLGLLVASWFEEFSPLLLLLENHRVLIQHSNTIAVSEHSLAVYIRVIAQHGATSHMID